MVLMVASDRCFVAHALWVLSGPGSDQLNLSALKGVARKRTLLLLERAHRKQSGLLQTLAFASWIREVCFPTATSQRLQRGGEVALWFSI